MRSPTMRARTLVSPAVVADDGSERVVTEVSVRPRDRSVVRPLALAIGNHAVTHAVPPHCSACRSLGGGVSMSTWPMMLGAVTPSNSASGSRIRRWASTGSASDFTSSGTT